MIKRHNLTGLKYLCKKTTNIESECYTYLGSGKYWKKHLNIHGSNITTKIIERCKTKKELIKKGIFWSNKLNVVKSNKYANLIPEQGDGGPTMLGRKMTQNQNLKKSLAHRRWWKSASLKDKERRRQINIKCHEIYKYYTPLGIFTNAYTAAKNHNCSNVTIINRCIKNTNKPIQSKRYWRFGWKNKTWKELGWFYKIITPVMQHPKAVNACDLKI